MLETTINVIAFVLWMAVLALFFVLTSIIALVTSGFFWFIFGIMMVVMMLYG